MKIVVDTNVLFSALLKEGNRFADTLQLSENTEFFIPKYAIVELFKYKEKIVKHSLISEEKILEVFYMLLKSVHVFDEELISVDSLSQAFYYCADVDEKDIIFLALAIELNAHIWTGDKKLTEGIQKKGFNNFFQPFSE